jgi:two-component system nitrogen regulation sensor histidine kinase NtrY
MTEELQENKRNLIRAERIAAWRDVARRIAHEIKNPLTPIEIAIYRIKKRLEAQAGEADRDRGDGARAGRAGDDRQVIEESLDSILKEVTALKTIAQEFSSFAKLPEPRPESLDMNETVKSVLELYASSSQQVEIKMRLMPRLPLVKADRDQMRSVIANLVKNAFEAMPSGGTLTVLTAVAKDTSTAPSHVHVEITDTGAGIPEEIRDKIFDPYFTTKPSGTGVGLALAYRILADHRAKISFKTGTAGTSFLVDLPVEAQS